MVETEDQARSADGSETWRPNLGAAARALALGGLSSAEILAVALVATAAVAASWASGALLPEDLVTEPWLRGLWAALVLAIIRPLTWLPYLGAFAGIRRLTKGIDVSERMQTAVSHVGAVVLVGGLTAVVLLAIEGGARFAASTLGFLAGAIPLEDLGSSLGSWPVWRILVVAVAVVLIRPVVPPVGPDLSIEIGPVLGLPPGWRGRIDTMLLWGSAGLAVVLGGLALMAAG